MTFVYVALDIVVAANGLDPRSPQWRRRRVTSATAAPHLGPLGAIEVSSRRQARQAVMARPLWEPPPQARVKMGMIWMRKSYSEPLESGLSRSKRLSLSSLSYHCRIEVSDDSPNQAPLRLVCEWNCTWVPQWPGFIQPLLGIGSLTTNLAKQHLVSNRSKPWVISLKKMYE